PISKIPATTRTIQAISALSPVSGPCLPWYTFSLTIDAAASSRRTLDHPSTCPRCAPDVPGTSRRDSAAGPFALGPRGRHTLGGAGRDVRLLVARSHPRRRGDPGFVLLAGPLRQRRDHTRRRRGGDGVPLARPVLADTRPQHGFSRDIL